MKKWTKVLLGALCTVSTLSMVACGGGGESIPEGYAKVDNLNGKTAEQTYNDIMTVINDCKGNFTCTTTYDATCNVMGMDILMDIEVIDKINGANLYEYSYVDTGDLGETRKMQVWYIEEKAEDGTITSATAYAQLNNGYINSANMTWAEICASADVDPEKIFSPLYDFTGYSFSDVSFFVDENLEDETDVPSYFKLVIKGDEAEEFANATMKVALEGAKTKFSNIEYKFVLTDEGTFDHAEIYYTVKMTYEGLTYNYVFDGDIVFSDIGTTVVTAPVTA
ncbi:MAG: hypothetical protein IJY05_01095 [Clostridia bacterium]|nr:hypothetical protein [Clostridia bacterium]